MRREGGEEWKMDEKGGVGEGNVEGGRKGGREEGKQNKKKKRRKSEEKENGAMEEDYRGLPISTIVYIAPNTAHIMRH